MSNWRKTLLWAMPEPPSTPDDRMLDTFKNDVKRAVLSIDPRFSLDKFNEAYTEFLMDDGQYKIVLPLLLYYIKQGYDWFVNTTAQEILDF